MALMDVNDVLRELEYDSDNDFDGYVSEDGECSDIDEDSACGESEECVDGEVSIPEYQETSGCTIDMTNKSPLDFFRLLVSDEMLEEIVEQTNIYAQ